MNKWVFAVGATIMLVGACTLDDGGWPPLGCEQAVTNCRVIHSDFYGYRRACSTTCEQQSGSQQEANGDGASAASKDDPGAKKKAETAAAPAAVERNLGAAPAPDTTRYSAFEGPCVRDSQCGPGKCTGGNCYYGCQSDAQCGSGDRCSVESGVRVCLPDPQPPVKCTRSAQCDDGSTCLDGGCRQTCTSTEQCNNPLDRCGSGVCLPDRRPLGECVVNSECDHGLVCLDGACVPACPAEEDGGVCLAEAIPPSPGLPESELPARGQPETPAQIEPPAESNGESGGGGSELGEGTGEATPSSDGESAEADQPPGVDPNQPEADESNPDAGTPISIIE
jgi:hypothetical protein